MNTVLNYLAQASTWRGLFAILTTFGVVIKPELSNAIIASGVALIGLVEVIRNEKA